MIRKIAPCSGNIIIVARLRILPIYAYLCCNQNQSRMKTNLRKSLWAALTLALTLSACGGSNAKKADNGTAQPDTTLVMTDSITTVSLRTGDTKLTWLKDHPQAYDLGECEFHLAFRVDDFEGAYAKHREMGCICYENKKMGIYFISDPDGYWIEIIPAVKQ